jgi:hypothetical protein
LQVARGCKVEGPIDVARQDGWSHCFDDDRGFLHEGQGEAARLTDLLSQCSLHGGIERAEKP